MTTYTEVTVTGYNTNPPPDDGTEVSANEISWDKHKDKLGDPLKDAIETTQTNITTAVNSIAAALEGFLFGLTLSNNSTDATNDIDIAAGAARNSTNVDTMELSSSLTKRLDAAWSVGTGQGGLDTGTIANTTYHVFLIKRSDTGVVDALFSTSATSPTMPTNYDRFRRIGSIIRSSAAILAFTQNGDNFILGTRATDLAPVGATAWALRLLTVPTGINVQPIISGTVKSNTNNAEVSVDVGDYRDTANNNPIILVRAKGGSSGYIQDTVGGALAGGIFTSTNGRIHIETSESASGASEDPRVFTHGWIDDRGRIT